MDIMPFPFTADGWQAFGSMLQGVGTVGGAIAVWLVARRAVRDWREQKQVENQIGAADRILTHAHDLSNFIGEVFEYIVPSYYKTIINWESLPDDRKLEEAFRNYAYACEALTLKLDRKIEPLAACRSSALIYFGRESAIAIDAMINSVVQCRTLLIFSVFDDVKNGVRKKLGKDGLTFADFTKLESMIVDHYEDFWRCIKSLDDLVGVNRTGIAGGPNS